MILLFTWQRFTRSTSFAKALNPKSFYSILYAVMKNCMYCSQINQHNQQFLKLSIVIVNRRLNKKASGETENKKNCIKQVCLWVCRRFNSLYNVCIGKVNTCIQWSKHFITPLFYILGKLYSLHSKICYKTGRCHSEAEWTRQSLSRNLLY